MQDLERAQHLQTHLPKPQDLVKGLNTFFRSKKETKAPLQDYEVKYALAALRHLKSVSVPEETDYLAEVREFDGLKALLVVPSSSVESHVELAAFLGEQQRKRATQKAGEDVEDEASNESTAYASEGKSASSLLFIQVMASYGQFDEALEGALQQDRQYKRSQNPRAKYKQSMGQIWNAIVQGCVRVDDEAQLLKVIEQMKELSVVPPVMTACAIVDFYLARDDLDAALDWYPHRTGEIQHNYRSEQIAAASKSACGIVLVSLRKGRQEVCEALIRQLTDSPSSKAWDAVILWAAGNGKGPDEINRMMDVMIQRSASARNPYEPDSVTINNLVKLANMRKDPYLAERFIHLGESRGISPDANTFIMQMEYRLSISDIDGARAAYLRLRATDTSGNQDVPIVNRLIQTMLATRRYPDETVMALVDDLNERNGLFDVDTVAALTLFHLQRDELHDLVDLLHTQTFNFSIAEREKVRDVLVNFCLDSRNNNTRAWDAYVICHQVFSETGRDIRTGIMRSFFERRRGDMAVHVFDAMRQHQDPAIRANADTYAEAFMGIGRSADSESLETIHNQMRIDQEIDRPPTKLYNALMFAYSECGQPGRAFAFWNDIATSREGPSYNSIILAFYVCERSPGQGDRIAQDIWEKLMKMDVEMTRELLTGYASALAGNQLVEEAKEVVKGMEEEYGMKPDVQTYVPSETLR